MASKDYYEILNVSRNAGPAIINVAFKTLAKIYHPDVASGDKAEAEEKFKDITEAYQVLSDADVRAKYDKEFFSNKNDRKSQSAEQKIDGWDVVEDFYPEIENERSELNIFDPNLAIIFQLYLIETKDYENSTLYYEELKGLYLKMRFGESERAREFGEYLALNSLNKIADNLEKQITILGSKKNKEIIKKIKQTHAVEIYGQSLEDLDEWFDEFIQFFKDFEFHTVQDLSLEFQRCKSILDDEFVLIVQIKRKKMGVFKPAISETVLTFNIDVLNCEIQAHVPRTGKKHRATYSSDEQAFMQIENRISKVFPNKN